MSVDEVEAALGPGEDVVYGALPGFYRKSLAAGGEAGSYRRWVKREGDTTTTVYVEFKDGKSVKFKDGKSGPAYIEQTGKFSGKQIP
jgi:hypothetical protein